MPEPCLDHDNNICGIPGCERPVLLKRAGPKAQHANCIYLVCFNIDAHGPSQRPWWHFFPKGTPTTNQSLPLVSSPPTPSTSTMPIHKFTNPHDFATPFPSQPKTTITRRMCSTSQCPAKRVAALCARQACKKHCVRQGGCLAPGHHVPEPQTSRRKMGENMPPASHSNLSLPLLDEHSNLSLPPLDDYSLSLLSKVGGAVPAYAAEVARQAEECELQEALEMSLSPPTVSQELRELMDQDARDLECALGISLGPSTISASDTSRSPSFSQLLPFASHAIAGPSRMLLPTPPSTLSPDELNTRLSTARPKKKSTTTVAVPKHTTHMSPSWMNPHVATTAAAIAAKTASSRRLKNRKIDEPPEQFQLSFWSENEKEAVLICVDNCPDWPSWRLSTAPELFTLCPDLTAVDVYSPQYKQWMQVSLNYCHKLTSNCNIIMRRRGIKCLDEQNVLDRMLNPVEPSIPHFRHHLSSQRKAVAATLRKKLVPITVVDSDSDIEVLPAVSPLKRRIKQEFPDEVPMPQKPRLTVTIPSTSGSFTEPISILNSPSLSPTSSLSASSPYTPWEMLPSAISSTTSLPSSASSSTADVSSVIDLTRRGKWPVGVYTVDMLEGFKKIDGGDRTGNPLPSRFVAAFGVPWKSSTYHDQRTRLRDASSAQIQKLVDAGRTPEGLWSRL